MIFKANGLNPVNNAIEPVERMRLTTGNSLATVNGINYDGLRIFTSGFNNQMNVGALDLWVGESNTTFIRWDGIGLIAGESNRLEIDGNFRGLWYNARSRNNSQGFLPRHIFNIDSIEVGRICPGAVTIVEPPVPPDEPRSEIIAGRRGFYRIGLNPTNIDADRRLEVFDELDFPQFRITQSQGTVFTDFQTTGSGHLGIDASGDRVGIEVSTPTSTLDVAGDANIRNVTQNDDLEQVLVRDPANNGKIMWRHASTLDGGGGSANVTADNGITAVSNKVQLGRPLGSSSGELIHHTEVPLNNFNLHFTGLGASGTNLVSVGQPATESVKFNVFNNHENTAGSFTSDASSLTYPIQRGLFGMVTNFNVRLGVGVWGYAKSIATTSEPSSVGVYGEAEGAQNNYGVYGVAQYSTGVTRRNYGGFFTASEAVSTNYGIWAHAPFTTTDWAGYFDGNVNVNGELTVYGSPVLTSDQMFKKNIDSISDAMKLINQFKPKTFFFDTINSYGMNFPDQKQYGLIAQEVEQVLPELITVSNKPEDRDSSGNVIHEAVTYKSLNYNAFIAILMRGIQEQQSQIDSLKEENSGYQNQIDSIFSLLNSLPSGLGSGKLMSTTMQEQTETSVHQINVELSSKNSIVLDQNVPNPFAEQTTISYNLPDDVKRAQIHFYNVAGKLINSVELTQKGKGQLNVFANDLSSGVYTYTLVADGNIIDTKKMVKQ